MEAKKKRKKKLYNYTDEKKQTDNWARLSNHENLGFGVDVVLLTWWTGPSFWIQWRRPFLWSWQIELGRSLKVPSTARDDWNCSSTFTTCQNSSLFSGCRDQHCSIKARIAGGHSTGITGLIFWKKHKLFYVTFLDVTQSFL